MIQKLSTAWVGCGLMMLSVGCGGDRAPASERISREPQASSVLFADKIVGSPNVTFVLEQVFGVEAEPAEAILSSAWAFDVASDGRVFVADRSGDAIVAFDADGRVMWRQERRGRGPGDLTRPHSIAVGGGSDDRLYVSNLSGERIDEWYVTGEFIGSQAAVDLKESTIQVAGFKPPNLLLAHSPIYGEPAMDAVVIDVSNWNVVRKFRIASEIGFDLDSNLNLPPTLRVANGRIFVGSVGQYVLRELDWEGDVLAAVSGNDELLAAPLTSSARVAATGMGGVRAPVVLSDGSWITSGSWVTNKADLEAIFRREPSSLARRNLIGRAHFLDVFEANGDLAGSLIWETTRARWAVFQKMDASGRVYSAMEDPFPQVRRYRVVRADR